MITFKLSVMGVGHKPLFVSILLCGLLSLVVLPVSQCDSIHFGKDIWPILAERCVQCHGEAKQEGELRLDSPEGVTAGGEYGAIIQTGEPGESTLVELISLPHDDSDIMPSKGEPLSTDEINRISRWIQEGASFKGWKPKMQKVVNDAIQDVASVALAAMPSEDQLPAADIDFNKDIRTILSDNCYKCHGPDHGALKADLRLDIEDIAKGDRDSAPPAIVPGSIQDSILVQRIFHPDASERMPPEGSDKSLTEQEKLLLAGWVNQGATYQEHWAYRPIQKSALPQAPQSSWNHNPIDRIVLASLAGQGIEPAVQADPVTLTRRLSLDLTGLLPAATDLDLLESKGVDVYIDALLQSPHFGERMAIHWLDQVRYADSNGYHSDEERSIYHYRDYVINAFNSNMSFDRFTKEQLAGDLLDNPTQDQLIASGFNRLNQITAEGGAQGKEYRAKYNADRVRAVSNVWMGITMACAECHDHKFDPFTTKDFYSLAAFFADITEDDVFPSQGDWGPVLRIPDEQQAASHDRLKTSIGHLEKQVKTPTDASRKEQSEWVEWIRENKKEAIQGWIPVDVKSIVSQNGNSYEHLDDLSELAVGVEPEGDVVTYELSTDLKDITGIKLEALPHHTFVYRLAQSRRRNQVNEFEVWVQPEGANEFKRVPMKLAESLELSEEDAAKLVDGDLGTAWGKTGADDKNQRNPLDFVFHFNEPLAAGPGTEIEVRIHYLGGSMVTHSAFGRTRLSLTTDKKPSQDALVRAPELINEAIFSNEVSSVQLFVDSYFITIADALRTPRAFLEGAYKQERDLIATFSSTLITVQREPRTTRVLPRGNWMDDSGEVVEPAIPTSLSVLPLGEDSEQHLTRLDLANWIVNPQNPLTARVYMNRLWKQFFGVGLSKVLDDLGAQGEWPKHIELLDWLSAEFIASDWDIKHMVKLITSSQTYQQASTVSAEKFMSDPDNRLLARQSAYRLEAELVRDTALSLSGLLNQEIGGPSVRPYQPEKYWENLNFPKRVYEHDENENQYRRGLYVHWQRSFLHPSLMAFDAPSREECVAERSRSNTPMQALTLLNDPTYVEAARVFAQRILVEGGDTVQARVDWAMEQAVLRSPSEEESQILLKVLFEHLMEYQVNPESAAKIVEVGMSPIPEGMRPIDVAAWTSVARIILNLHETITRS